jgi:tetratricopeptide (TPR) repeat protein
MTVLDAMADDEVATYVEDFRKSLANEPKFLQAYYLGQLNVTLGKHTDAQPLLEEAIVEARTQKSNFIYRNVYLSICLSYAQLLDYLGDIEKAQSIYKELSDEDPDGVHLGDYAVFLHRRKRDFARAHAMYTKCLALYPEQSAIHLKFAGFLRHVKRDLTSAEKHYRLAVDANPEYAEALGSYASYLHGVRGDLQQAESYYEKAVKADMTHTNNLCNFGLFLSEERRDFEQAETYYR